MFRCGSLFPVTRDIWKWVIAVLWPALSTAQCATEETGSISVFGLPLINWRNWIVQWVKDCGSLESYIYIYVCNSHLGYRQRRQRPATGLLVDAWMEAAFISPLSFSDFISAFSFFILVAVDAALEKRGLSLANLSQHRIRGKQSIFKAQKKMQLGWVHAQKTLKLRFCADVIHRRCLSQAQFSHRLGCFTNTDIITCYSDSSSLPR